MSEEIKSERYFIQPNDSIQIIVTPVDLSGGIKELRANSKKFLESVWSEISY